MNKTELYIGDNIVDLMPDQQVAISIKKIDIGQLSTRYINYTDKLNGPLSENNQKIFGFSNDEASQSSVPYRINSGKLVQNGVEVIPKASVILKKVKGRFEFNVYENFFDYFSVVDGLNLMDIDPIAPSAWTASAIDSARLNTDGIVSVILNWGKSGGIYQANYFLPCFYYHTIIKAILEHTGLTLSGDILTDSRFTDLVIPFPGDEFLYPESVTGTASGKATNNGQNVIDLLASDVYERVELDAVSYGTMWNLTADQFEFATTLPYITVNISAFFSVNSITWNSGTTLTGRIYKYSGGVETLLASATICNNPATSGSITVSYSGVFIPGDFVYMAIASDAAGVLGVTFSIVNTSYLEIVGTREVSRTMVSWNLLWPEISCVDLLKDFFTRFAIIPKLVNETLYLKSLEDILTDRENAIDWSSKIVKKKDIDISFDLPYAQVNNFDYTNLDTVNDANLGRGTIDVDNSTIEGIKTIYTSIFGNTRTEYTGVYNVATIPVYNSSSSDIDEFADQPELRLLTLKSRTTETGITFNVSLRTDYKLGYFVDASQTKDTGWEYFLGQFYATLEGSLQKNKVLNQEFYLNELDIANYDHHKLIYYGDGYALLNSIKNFIPGAVTQVENIKII